MSTTVLSMISEGLREVRDAVNLLGRDMNDQLSKLPDLYVPRREVDRRFDELICDVAELRKHREAEAAERATARRWVIGLAVATSMSGIGVISGVVLHFT